ncbi:MAG: hypothetical protein AAGA48_07110 [Myxococcota bacterium]
MTPSFCSPFDETLAREGPAAIFLLDREGLLRFDAEWTRDAWGRHPGPHLRGEHWTLVRDRASGFVQQVLCTGPRLLDDHPRLDARSFPDREAANVALAAFGHPPIASEPWS